MPTPPQPRGTELLVRLSYSGVKPLLTLKSGAAPRREPIRRSIQVIPATAMAPA